MQRKVLRMSEHIHFFSSKVQMQILQKLTVYHSCVNALPNIIMGTKDETYAMRDLVEIA